MDWNEAIRSYIRVVDEGSFTGAARRLNTTSSAISKRIHWLEERVGVQLLKRTTRTINLTEAGALFYKRSCVQMEQWQSVIDETRSVNQTPAGVLKIGATLVVGSKFIVRYLNDFLQQYPDIKVQLITTIPGQLPEMSLDLHISRKLEQLNSLSFKATPLFEHSPEFFASPDYLASKGTPLTVDALKQHNILLWGEQLGREMVLSNGQRISLEGNFVTTNPEALFYGAKAGMGVLATSRVLIEDLLESGDLVQILPSISAESTTVYAYYPKLDYEHTRTKLFIDYLKLRLSSD
ncbi:LysR family transcriptional regulator [Vibrio tapetis subsp. quintayensis]|uniref:LysR family transcriptional regulator n=1 Tax=Vibrio tapetis TaxID=52443 RepID=UPI0025B4EBDA|nr:LysR family transcriptional regulator [Vibrio tapetis]MDN3681901.1 LysR family transcriptional regulator [Vibrio tapetis subsp. quintayensis]